jgi:hypothetical protein
MTKIRFYSQDQREVQRKYPLIFHCFKHVEFESDDVLDENPRKKTLVNLMNVYCWSDYENIVI